MNRVIIIISIFIIVTLGYIVIFLNQSSWKPFYCNTHVSSHITSIEGSKVELNLDINVVTAQKGSSELFTTGTIKWLNKDYDISRWTFISVQDSGLKNFNKIKITREKINPADNFPDEIWQKYILPNAFGVEFYIERKKLNNNTFLIKGLSYPYFVCTVVES